MGSASKTEIQCLFAIFAICKNMKFIFLLFHDFFFSQALHLTAFKGKYIT